MVYPDLRSAEYLDRITTPDQRRVEVLYKRSIDWLTQWTSSRKLTVIWRFWIIILDTPPRIRKPLPLMTPAVPTPTILLLLPRSIGVVPAL